MSFQIPFERIMLTPALALAIAFFSSSVLLTFSLGKLEVDVSF
jgi:hypothetical protein